MTRGPPVGKGKRLYCSRRFLSRFVKGIRPLRTILTLALVLWPWCGEQGIAAPVADAEHFLCEVWQVEDGLPGNDVTSVAQTPDGYLWVGTYGGLARFDGVRFQVFDADTPGLGSRQITGLFVDQQGGLWVAMLPGKLARYAKGRFTAFNADDGWTMKLALSFAQGLDNAVIITDAEGRAFRFREGRFSALDPDSAGSSGSYQERALDASGTQWALSGEGRLLVRHGDQWEPFMPEGDSSPPPARKLVARRQGGVWILEDRRIRLIENDRWTRDYGDTSGLELESVACIREDASGNLLVGTSNSQLFRFSIDGLGGVFSTQNEFPRGTIADIREDLEGNYWVACRGGGLVRLKRAVFRSLGAAQGLPPEAVLSLAEDESGRLTLGTLGGGMFVMENGRFFGPLALPGTSLSACALRPSRSGGVWLGTDGAGLLKLGGLNPGRWSLRDGSANRSITALYEDHTGMLWIGTKTGLIGFDGQRFTHYSASDGLSDGNVRVIAQDRAGDLWIGTASGLNRYQGGKFTSYSSEDGLSSDHVQALLADPNGDLWIGTLDGGLSRFREGRFVNYSVKHGLPDNSVAVILDDGLGFLWLGTGRGVCRVSRSELTSVSQGSQPRIECAIYLKNDGLDSLECASGNPAGIVARDGRLWFATPHGVSVVDPRRIPRNPVPPTASVEEVLVDGEVVFSNRGTVATGLSEAPSSGLRIPAGRRYMEIGYTGLSFTSPTQVRFRVQLEGLDNEWQDVGLRRVAYFNGLPPGQYRFRVRAANNDGVWSETGAALAFTVMPSYWQTWWFRGVGLGSLAAAILLAFRDYIVGLERKRASDELKASEARYRRLFEASQDGILILEAETGEIVDVNPYLLKTLGYSKENLVGKKLWEIGAFHDRADARAAFDKLQTHDYLRQEDSSLESADGRRVEMEFVSSVYAIGKSKLIQCSFRDITARKRVEAALRTNEEKLRSLFTSMAEGVAVHEVVFDDNRTPIDYRILDVNPAYEKHLGFSAERAKGKLASKVFGIAIPPCLDIFARVAETGQPQSFETHYWVPQKYFRISVFSTAKGKFATVFEDITERMRAEETLRSVNLLNESLIQSIPFGLDIVDEHGRILFLNEKLKKLAGSNSLGTRCWEVYKDDLRQCAHCPLLKPVRIGALETVETSGALGGRVLRITHFGILFQGRKALLELFEDITETRETRRKLELLERQRVLDAERSRIARDMHDELGTALTKITLLSERAESEVTSQGDANMQQAGSWMRRITAMGREMVISMDEIVWVVNPRNDQLENLASYLSHYAQEFLNFSKIQCLLEIPSALPQKTLKAELRHHLFMIVKEALNNAVKHSGATQAGLMITFESETLSITVVDNGRGLDLNQTERSGDGLRNIRHRAQEIGGEIEFRSRPGQGTWVILRVVLDSAESGDSS